MDCDCVDVPVTVAVPVVVDVEVSEGVLDEEPVDVRLPVTESVSEGV